MGPLEKGGRYGRERMYFRVVRVLKNAYYQFGRSLNLRTGPTGNATLFNQWCACVYQNVDPVIKIFSQWRTEADRALLFRFHYSSRFHIISNKTFDCKRIRVLFIARNRWGVQIFRTDRRGRGFTGMACKIFDRSKLVPCKNSLIESVKICWDHTKQDRYYLLASTGQESKNQSS